jgi:DNA primase
MGSSLSEEQENLLCRHFREVTMCFDGDSAGRVATEDSLKRLARRVFVKVIVLPDGKQPDMLSHEEIARLVSSPTH